MKKILTTVYLSSAILFGQCVVKGAQIEKGLTECADEARTYLQAIKNVMKDDLGVVKGAQIEKGLTECADAVRTHLQAIKDVMGADLNANKWHKKLLE